MAIGTTRTLLRAAHQSHLKATLADFQVPQQEQGNVLGFIDNTRDGIVEA